MSRAMFPPRPLLAALLLALPPGAHAEDEAGGGPLLGFLIADKQGNFLKANAQIINNEQGKPTVIKVWSDKVPHPTAVRYAWEDNPDEANLVNEEGLPAAPFRTDDWKGPTDGRR